MASEYQTDRIDLVITPSLKRRYLEFARRVYHLGLSTWIKMLMRQDYVRHHPDEDDEE